MLETRPDLVPMIQPLLASAAAPREQIKRLDAEIAAAAAASSPARSLMTVPGVGPVGALAFAAPIGEAHRFSGSRAVGPRG